MIPLLLGKRTCWNDKNSSHYKIFMHPCIVLTYFRQLRKYVGIIDINTTDDVAQSCEFVGYLLGYMVGGFTKTHNADR